MTENTAFPPPAVEHGGSRKLASAVLVAAARVRRNIRGAASSMRHQHRNRHGAEHIAGDAAPDEFAQARMAVAAHHDEIGAVVGRVREDRALHVDIAAGDALDTAGTP